MSAALSFCALADVQAQSPVGSTGDVEDTSAVERADGAFRVLSFPDIQAVVEASDGAPVVRLGSGISYRIAVDHRSLVAADDGDIKQKRAPADAIPFGLVAEAVHSGLKTWLSAPTARYAHGVLGDAVEAGALVVEYRDGSRQTLVLPDDRVFEDNYPRFVGMPDPERESILTVTSYLRAGAALTLVDPGSAGGSAPRVIAESAPIGTPNRWLNPVGVGDVDGDGRIEALAVVTPHIGGDLVAYELRDSRFVKDKSISGFSNHAIGSRELALSGVADLDTPPDGIPEVIVPGADRKSLTVVRFTGRQPEIAARLILAEGRVAHRLVPYDLDGDGVPEISFGTDRNVVIVWNPRL